MNQTTTTQGDDLFDQQVKGLPGMLNVLTILTFIGCGIAYLSAVYSFITSSNYEKQLAEMQELQDNMGDQGGMGAQMMQGSIEMLEKTHEYRYIILISTILFTTLCLIGAMQMRKLKKQGYIFYLVGQLLPFVTTLLFLGTFMFAGVGFAVSTGITILFILLYTVNRKHLIY
ncbi:MAG: hypothetical protein EOO43_26895 [Flavobacterium sp.]|nr:MAG: hypothetical protein EOO43_26895 [Flavobacterium sp.]